MGEFFEGAWRVELRTLYMLVKPLTRVKHLKAIEKENGFDISVAALARLSALLPLSKAHSYEDGCRHTFA